MPDSISVAILATRSSINHALIHAIAGRWRVPAVVFESQSGLRARLFAKRIGRLGPWRVGDQLALKALDVAVFQREASRRFGDIMRSDGRLHLERLPETRILDTDSINSDSVAELLGSVSPDVVVVSGTSILDEKLIHSLAGIPTVNIHCGVTPRYRGAHGAFWAVVNEDWDNVGVTIHLVDENIDTGGVIAQGQIELTPDDNPRTLALKQYAVGIGLLLDSMPKIASGEYEIVTRSDLDSRLYSSPTLSAYLRYRKNMRDRFLGKE